MSISDTLNSQTCAELLMCSRAQVEELARGGEIPGVKLGRGWLFVRADLLVYLAQRGRQEAEERRSARAPNAIKVAASQKRRAPPSLGKQHHKLGGDFPD